MNRLIDPDYVNSNEFIYEVKEKGLLPSLSNFKIEKVNKKVVLRNW